MRQSQVNERIGGARRPSGSVHAGTASAAGPSVGWRARRVAPAGATVGVAAVACAPRTVLQSEPP